MENLRFESFNEYELEAMRDALFSALVNNNHHKKLRKQYEDLLVEIVSFMIERDVASKTSRLMESKRKETDILEG